MINNIKFILLHKISFNNKIGEGSEGKVYKVEKKQPVISLKKNTNQ